MIRIILSFLITINVLESKPQNIEFFREDLTFEIKNSYFYVDGLYYFCNVSNKLEKHNLYYPFPNDSIYGKIDSIMITNLGTSKQIEFVKKEEKGIYFNINIEPYGIEKYRIRYKQKLNGNQAEYILTTTQSWKKPFEIVNYQLIVPEDIKIISISYEADSVFLDKTDEIYIWKKRDFMPNKNIIFRFENTE